MPARDFPSIEPTNIQVIPIIPTVINRSISGRETRDQVGSPYFELRCEFSNLDANDRRLITGHIAATRGPLLAFFMKLPTSMDDATGAASGTISISTSESGGATTLNYIKASTQNQTVFKAGDMIQFSNHGKIYEVTEDSVSTAQNGSVNIFPPLKTAVFANATINYQNLEILVRYKTDFNYEIGNNLFAGLVLDFVEVLE